MGTLFQGWYLISHPYLLLCIPDNFPGARLPAQGTLLFGQAISSGFLWRKDAASFPRKPPEGTQLLSEEPCPGLYTDPEVAQSHHSFKCLLSEFFVPNTVLVVGEQTADSRHRG